jgi:hypothetical protein
MRQLATRERRRVTPGWGWGRHAKRTTPTRTFIRRIAGATSGRRADRFATATPQPAISIATIQSIFTSTWRIRSRRHVYVMCTRPSLV